MKTIFRFLSILLLTAPTLVRAITVDGTAESAYGAPLAVQQIGSGFGDNNLGTISAANGSELDAAYGFISNNTLHVFMAGNLEGLSNVFNKIEIFIDSVTGGQNTLSNNNTVTADSSAVPRMSFNGTSPGLTFDAGFTADYWIGVVCGGGPPATLFINYGTLPTLGGGSGAFWGSVNPTTNGTLTGTNPFGAKAALNDLNIAGVSGNNCATNSLGATQSVAAASVTTGVELAIPLSAIGSPTGSVKVCAFVNGQNHDFICNQILGSLGTNALDYCQANLGEPRTANLSTFPGQHYFVVDPVGCNFGITPVNTNIAALGGTGSVGISVGAGCAWTATNNADFIAITSGASGNGPGTVGYSVGTNGSTCARSGTMTIAGQTFTVFQAAGSYGPIVVDGNAEAAYGCPIASQSVATGFGDSNNGLVDAANGSELDAGFGTIQDGVLYLVLAGNLEANFNKLEIFLQTGPGGVSTLSTNNPNVDGNGLNRMGMNGNATNGPTFGNSGLTFDPGFAPNYYIGVTGGGAPYALFANYAQLWPGGTNSNGFATNGYFLGSTAAATDALAGGTNPFCVQATINNSNTNGVVLWDGTTGCYSNGGALNPGSIRTGVELAIPLGALGSPTGPIKVCAFINGAGHDYVSNQILGPLWDGTSTYCIANWGEPSDLPMGLLPGQHFFVVGPEMRVTSIAKSDNDINVSWQTQSNSNLIYQLQYARALTNNTTWTDLGSPTNGTGVVVTQSDLNAATNQPALFYRVKQTSLCP